MNLEEFEHELRTNSTVKRSPNPDKKWCLHDLAYNLRIIGYREMPRERLIKNILYEEEKKRYTTQEKKEKGNFEFEITCDKPGFEPYTIKIYIGSQETHNKLMEDILEAEEVLCDTAEWFLEPLKKALGL